MAEPDYGAASWAHVTTGPGHQGAELAAPLLSAHAPFQQQLPPLYGGVYLPMSDHQTPQSRNVPDGPAGNPLHDRSPYPPAGIRYPYYQPHMFPYQFTGHPRPPPSFWNGVDHVHPDQLFSNPSNTMQGHLPGQTIGMPHQNNPLAPALNAGIPPFIRRRNEHRMAVEAMSRNSHAGGMRTPHQGHRDSAHPEVRLQSTRSQPHEHRQPNDPLSPGSGHRPWASPGGHGRRSDRSISPRTSNRRSFERYSVDLSPSSTSSDAEEAAARAPPPNRLRTRTRDVRPRFTGYRPHIDPNIATPRQIQELKDGLPRRLPSELPDDASKCCDICQKDYSASHVLPTEDEEIAVVLSCGHTFGEFCIFQWLDTCKTHKNKVTCPMCRKQLIEAPRYLQSMMHAFPRNGQAFVDLLAREQLLANGIPREFHNL
ncbi:hypothetical protein COCCADRAFT_109373 [Bipolaris zeicola 26-R-13]|uniref:RING-type domain-containing protein n=1 Tax=Cochliobolus carbonum (strain 26-R-13) TaxID=930089 RepID=W6YB32_COCC2|nr:uncharacterized protein COCCADRAFT_109373 [Bipolaris zeicola 26-R-13]EUC28351.1 hypothetical protein COCCADRAFT_109373 [Bipolaris zeicola 26-R-13]